MYRVDKSVVLTAGRETPAAGKFVLRGEGVALVLGEKAVRAWEATGKQWKGGTHN